MMSLDHLLQQPLQRIDWKLLDHYSGRTASRWSAANEVHVQPGNLPQQLVRQ